MQLRQFPTYDHLCQHTASHIAGLVAQKPTALLCLASGETPIGVFHTLVALAREGRADFSQCTFIGLDEWVGFGPTDPGSCSFYLYRDLFAPLQLRPDQIVYFDAKSPNLAQECQRVDAAIAQHGSLDLLLVGIGMNGHIALNEPGTPFSLRAHVVDLHEMTITVGQKYFSESTTLTTGITVGLQHLTEAREVILMANGARKAGVVREALHGPVTEQFPASIIQTHPNAQVWLDSEAAKEVF